MELTIIYLAAYFYADDGLVASTQPKRLQKVFGVLTGIFNRVILQKNTENTASMVYEPFHMPDMMSEEAYNR